jgi:hypothetical protein
MVRQQPSGDRLPSWRIGSLTRAGRDPSSSASTARRIDDVSIGPLRQMAPDMADDLAHVGMIIVGQFVDVRRR